MNTYKVTCLKCNEQENLKIDDSTHQVTDFGRKAETNLLSARFRGDGVFGFECKCGNDNRLASSERGDFDTLVQGDKVSVKKIKDSLKLDDSKQFLMEAI